MKPDFLKKGDRVYCLNISRRGLVDFPFVVQLLEQWGLIPIIGATITGDSHAQFAAAVADRLSDFQTAIDDPDIKALFFCRGGYGAVHILDQADFTAFIAQPKWIIGFSDLCYLHTKINVQLGIETLHAPMLFGFHRLAAADLDTLRELLFGDHKQISYTGLENHKIKEVSGQLLGGNLSILHTVIGTPTDIDTRDKILFIEDIHEDLTSIERMLYAFKRAGKFENLRALLLGDFIIPLKEDSVSNYMMPEYPHPSAADINTVFRAMVLKLLEQYHFPVCFGLPIGHLPERNSSLYLGSQVKLLMTSNTLTVAYE